MFCTLLILLYCYIENFSFGDISARITKIGNLLLHGHVTLYVLREKKCKFSVNDPTKKDSRYENGSIKIIFVKRTNVLLPGTNVHSVKNAKKVVPDTIACHL